MTTRHRTGSKLNLRYAYKVKDRVSVKKNAHGVEMAPIVAENNVAVLTTKAIETELNNRGFVLGDGAARLLVELQKFYNDFKSGFGPAQRRLK